MTQAVPTIHVWPALAEADPGGAGFETERLRAECAVGPRGDLWILTEDLVAWWRGRRIVVSRGYPTDGASIPRAAWAVIGHPWDYYLPAAIVHDALYAAEVWPRQEADACFHDLMQALSVEHFRLHAMYYAVRLFGLWAWRHHTPESIAYARAHLMIEEPAP